MEGVRYPLEEGIGCSQGEGVYPLLEGDCGALLPCCIHVGESGTAVHRLASSGHLESLVGAGRVLWADPREEGGAPREV